MLNRAILMGRLTADPELRQTPNGVSVASFTLAVNRNYSKNAQQQTDFIDIVAWRQTAEFVSRYFRKGQLVAVDGQIQTRTYTDRNGVNRKAFEIVADQVHFAESKASAERAASQPAPTPFEVPNPAATQAPAFESGDLGDFAEIPADDDLPF